MNIRKWEIFEVVLAGPADGNPFVEVSLSATFACGGNMCVVQGFYDGEGVYKIRFMPDVEGVWTYRTNSNRAELDGHEGSFHCVAAQANVHGPVIVGSAPAEFLPGLDRSVGTRFCYADGSAYLPVGTTCYAWVHQGDVLEEQTLKTLASAPFNKLRMCLFPKHYDYNLKEPVYYAFAGSPDEGFDFTRFNPEFFRHLEMRIAQLGELGIEADLILFHPYDRWGFSKMDHETDIRYLRYTVARLAAFRNVWWSFANEYDLMPEKSLADWDDFFRTVMTFDPYHHLRSIHNCIAFYDHSKKWVTHVSVQHGDIGLVNQWMEQYQKPVVVDECGYEGDLSHDWGNLTAQEMVNRMWIGFSQCAFVGHGETYLDESQVLWWSHGGVLKGESPKRIAFLRSVFESIPGTPCPTPRFFGSRNGLHVGEDFYLKYFDIHQPRGKQLQLPEEHEYKVEILDTWECTITALDGRFHGVCTIPMPGKPYQALRMTRID